MYILLTGGAGFIGHHLTKHFLDSGRQIVTIDNFSTGRRQNVTPYLANPNYRLIEGNARDAAVMEPLIADAAVVYNLAASVGVQKIFHDPIVDRAPSVEQLALRL